MFYVDLIVCIICIHMITLGSPCKRHEVLVRVGVTRIANQEVLPRVGMTRIGKQGVMARVGRTRIVMHGRLPRGKSALDRELAIVLVSLGVWLDIDSDKAGNKSNEDGNIVYDKTRQDKTRQGLLHKVVAADHNCRNALEPFGLKRWFHSAVMIADQTAVSPLLVKPKEKPRAFSEGDHCAADVSEQHSRNELLDTLTHNQT
ncbi:hypothetical protein Q3G72_000729 [Acer saccharum]|nr:hypothetical protein Q3G72_000729 [Acer saccharum]